MKGTSETTTQPQEAVEALVDMAGSGERAASWLGVTPQSVSEWRRSGGISAQSLAQVEMLVCRHRHRYMFIYGWIMERTTPVREPNFKLVFESADDDALGLPQGGSGVNRNHVMPFTKQGRGAVVKQLSITYLAHDLLADGDVLVFFRPGETDFVYVDAETTVPMFTRRAWEPWWPLRRFIREGK